MGMEAPFSSADSTGMDCHSSSSSAAMAADLWDELMCVSDVKLQPARLDQGGGGVHAGCADLVALDEGLAEVSAVRGYVEVNGSGVTGAVDTENGCNGRSRARTMCGVPSRQDHGGPV